MTTDNHPRSYVYLSRRLLSARYQQHAAAASGVEWGMDLSAPGLGGVNASRADRSDNIYWLAGRVTDAVSDNTGSPLYPGEYVRAVVNLSWGVLGFVQPEEKVAFLFGTAATDEGDVFVGLIGSLHNYVDVAPERVEASNMVFHVSSPSGLRYLVDAYHAADADGRGVTRPSTAPDERDTVSAAWRISKSFASDEPEALLGRDRPMEVLMQVYESTERPDRRWGGPSPAGHLRGGLVGAPLWVATPSPTAQDFHTDPRKARSTLDRSTNSRGLGRLRGLLGR